MIGSYHNLVKWALEKGYTHITNGIGTIPLEYSLQVFNGRWKYGDGEIVKHSEKTYKLLKIEEK